MEEINSRVPGLLYEADKLKRMAIQPTGVLLPVRLVVAYAGGPNHMAEARCINLPVTWSAKEEWGLIVHLPTQT